MRGSRAGGGSLKTIYRPAWVLDGSLRSEFGIPDEAAARVCGLDEDEATLGVAAARGLLSRSGLGPSEVRRLEASSRTSTGWGATAALALGLARAEVAEIPPTAQPAPPGPGVLRVTAEAPRAGAEALESGRIAALATAQWAEPGESFDASLPRVRILDRPAYDRLARWEPRALSQVPMGANIPLSTWNQSAEARYRLLASQCPLCKRGNHPPLDPCPTCGGRTEARELLAPGELYTFTHIAKGGGPSEFDPLQETEGSYAVAVVAWDGGIRVAGLVTETEPESLRIGARMEPVFRRLYAQEGAWRYGTKFRAQG